MPKVKNMVRSRPNRSETVPTRFGTSVTPGDRRFLLHNRQVVRALKDRERQLVVFIPGPDERLAPRNQSRVLPETSLRTVFLYSRNTFISASRKACE